jgi:hypothetical protein
MSRRAFLKSLTALVGGIAFPIVAHASIRGGAWKTLQTSPLAGFQYHGGEALWLQLAVGQSLQLMRETDNRYDDRAVRVEWEGRKLGCFPGWIMLPFRNCLIVASNWKQSLPVYRTARTRGKG